ncbi:hypothetical protein CK203_062946 [Vitis vinifera]|uniref:Uncharacterized protein n=1 Tax=Vitis vinifera TaxID=29760 RepID=A0A438G9Q0_VITVI|nr:hypothetical protein CK203_062946 [Vitis vinifera]
MTSSRAEINGMMVMVQSTLRLNFFNYGSSLSIVIERSSKSSDAFIATFDFTSIYYFGCLTTMTSPTFSAPTTFPTPYIGYIDMTYISTFGSSGRYSSLGTVSPSLMMLETLFRLRHTPE